MRSFSIYIREASNRPIVHGPLAEKASLDAHFFPTVLGTAKQSGKAETCPELFAGRLRGSQRWKTDYACIAIKVDSVKKAKPPGSLVQRSGMRILRMPLA